MSGADYARIHNPELTEHYVYRLYGEGGRLLYVGCSMNLAYRIYTHRRNLRMGPLVARVETEGPFNYQDGRRRERELIEREPGEFNVEWTPGHRRGATSRRSPASAEVRARLEAARHEFNEGWAA